MEQQGEVHTAFADSAPPSSGKEVCPDTPQSDCGSDPGGLCSQGYTLHTGQKQVAMFFPVFTPVSGGNRVRRGNADSYIENLSFSTKESSDFKLCLRRTFIHINKSLL